MASHQPKTIISVLSALALLTLGAFAFVNWNVLAESDSIASTRQASQLQKALDDWAEQIPHDQASVARSTATVYAIRNERLDWIHDHIGRWLHSYFKHDQTYVLNDDDKLVYWANFGVAKSPAALAPDVKLLIESLTSDLRAAIAKHGPAATQKSKTLLRAQNFTYIDGVLSIVSAVPVTAAINEMQILGDPPILISVKKFDVITLDKIANALLIKNVKASYIHVARHAALPITNNSGKQLGFIMWDPELPGSLISQRTLPIALASAITFLLILAIFGRLLHEKGKKLAHSEAQARHKAYHDALTGLPNRSALLQVIDTAASSETSGAVLILDLDRFKQVNDSLGHAAGDELIQAFSERVGDVIADMGTLCRLGGDEFAAVIGHGFGEDDVKALCERIIEAVRKPYEISGSTAFVGVSIGVICFEKNGDARELLRQADIALYAAKKGGKSCYRFFSEDMDKDVQRRKTIELELRDALARSTGLVVYYQPEVSAASREVVGYEALVRWQHPRLGFLAPAAFLPVAEDSGLVGDLDLWVLSQACQTALDLQNDEFIAVNISAGGFRAPGLAARALAIIKRSGIAPGRVQLEVTETLLLADEAVAAAELNALRMAGVRIALDDFGTGYSSLSHLKKLTVDKIKIDRSFVEHIYTQESIAIVSAVVGLGRAMCLEITAEGVENSDQADFLKAAGCTELQGYYFSKPLPYAEIRAKAQMPKSVKGLR